jgi:hypothetical protein
VNTIPFDRIFVDHIGSANFGKKLVGFDDLIVKVNPKPFCVDKFPLNSSSLS